MTIYTKFKRNLNEVLKMLHIQEHNPHDCRHTFATKMCISRAKDILQAKSLDIQI